MAIVMATLPGDRAVRWWHNAGIWERVVGTIAGAAVGAALVSSRTIPYTMPVLALAMLAGLWSHRRIDAQSFKLTTPAYVAIAFLLYAALSILWAFKPSGGVVPLVTACGYLAGYFFVVGVLAGDTKSAVHRIAEGFCMGLVFGIVYLGYEILTDQSLKLAIYKGLHLPKTWLRPTRDFTWANGELVAIAPSDLKRNIAPIALLVWSALLVLRTFVTAPALKRALPALLFVAVAFVVFKSDHETSKAAMVWSVVIFLLAQFSAQASRRVLQVAWVFACLSVVPLSLAAHRLDFHNAHWIQDSFRHRIIIWNNTAEETMKKPIFGIGAGMMYQIDPAGERREADEDFSRIAPHAHNIYLQTWFELGAIGALLLTIFGLAVIDRIRLLTEGAMPYAYATFASVMVMIAASYGMWQPWFIAMFAMCAVMFTAAVRLQREDDGIKPAAPANDPSAPGADVPVS